MKISFTIAFILTLFCFVLNANDGEQNLKTIKTESYELKYPEDWQFVEVDHQNIEFYIVAPLTNTDDKFGDNVNLAIEVLTKDNNTLKKFAKTSERKIENFVDDSKIISQTTIGKKKKAYHRIEYSASYKDTDGVYWLQYYILKNNHAFIITAMIEENQKDFYLDTMINILDSFKVKKVK